MSQVWLVLLPAVVLLFSGCIGFGTAAEGDKTDAEFFRMVAILVALFVPGAFLVRFGAAWQAQGNVAVKFVGTLMVLFGLLLCIGA